METKNSSWLSQASRIGLLASLSLVVFGLLASLVYLAFSIVIWQLELREEFFALNLNLRYGLVTIAVFAIMLFSLFFSEKWLDPRIQEIEEAVGTNTLFILSLILTVILLTLFYFGFTNYLSFINNRFWI